MLTKVQSRVAQVMCVWGGTSPYKTRCLCHEHRARHLLQYPNPFSLSLLFWFDQTLLFDFDFWDSKPVSPDGCERKWGCIEDGAAPSDPFRHFSTLFLKSQSDPRHQEAQPPKSCSILCLHFCFPDSRECISWWVCYVSSDFFHQT